VFFKYYNLSLLSRFSFRYFSI